MTLPLRKECKLRLPPDLYERAEKTRRFRGKTAQIYLLDALERAVEADEQEMERRGERRRRANEPRGNDHPAGGLYRNRPRPELRPVAVESSPPVVVNVGGGSPDADIVDRLAARILRAPAHERAYRISEAKTALATLAKSEDERGQLLRALEAKISGEPAPPGDELPSFNAFAKTTLSAIKRFVE